jgi:hypothetical protein
MKLVLELLLIYPLVIIESCYNIYLIFALDERTSFYNINSVTYEDGVFPLSYTRDVIGYPISYPIIFLGNSA